MSDDERKPRRRPTRPSREGRRRATGDEARGPDAAAVDFRARLEAIPDLEAEEGSRSPDAPRRSAFPARFSRTARQRSFEGDPAPEPRGESAWDPPLDPSDLDEIDAVDASGERDERDGSRWEPDDDADLDRETAAIATVPPADGGDRGPHLHDDADDDLFGDLDELIVPRDRTLAPPSAPWYRRMAFAVSLLVLFAAIPVLGREGYRLVAHSRAGRDASVNLKRTDPNYVELVQSTPTAVIAQTDDEGRLLALTVLSLTGDSGGSVLFVPVESKLRKPRYLSSRVSSFFEATNRKLSGLPTMVGEVLGVGIDRVEGFDDGAFTHWLEPVGGISFVNPDDVMLSDGTHLAPGEVTLEPEQVGPYLAYLGEDEDQFSQYLRHQLVWQAWLAAVTEDPDARVPGGETDPLAPFFRHLAEGNTRIETIPGTYHDNGQFDPDEAALTALIVDAVPSPTSPAPGVRVRVRLLNGVQPSPPDPEIVRSVVAEGGTILVVGNGPDFDHDLTEIVYSDPDHRGVAEEMLAALGSTGGTIRELSTPDDETDLTIILGRDVVDAGEGA